MRGLLRKIALFISHAGFPKHSFCSRKFLFA